MSDLRPTILDPITLPAFLEHILAIHAAPSTLIVCSTKSNFLAQLQTSLEHDQPHHDVPAPPTTHPFLAHPTLRLLATAKTLRLAFCPDITHLRAYLATFAHNHSQPQGPAHIDSADYATGGVPILALLNPLGQHRTTSAWSAQGLNRTFAAAVEAAFFSKAKLVIAEALAPNLDPAVNATEPETEVGVEVEADRVQDDADAGAGEAENEGDAGKSSRWDEEVSILNVTTKSFGAGERGWVGRTVAVRRVVGRWCAFAALPEEDETLEGPVADEEMSS